FSWEQSICFQTNIPASHRFRQRTALCYDEGRRKVQCSILNSSSQCSVFRVHPFPSCLLLLASSFLPPASCFFRCSVLKTFRPATQCNRAGAGYNLRKINTFN